ncbi:MAG: hypothetical protein ACK4N5_19135 [Myxococcales bacterium]
MRARLPWLALATALLTAAGPDAGAPGAGRLDAGATEVDAGDPCAKEEARLARRKAWLAARRQEQFEKGGPPNPALGIPNMTGLWCLEHPDDEECQLGPVPLELGTDELTPGEGHTPEDLDSHVILMKRALRDCRSRHLTSPFRLPARRG